MNRDFATAQHALRHASRVYVLTGAGISAESGVPTFRGGAGAPVWRGLPFDQLSSARMVENDLALVWEWFDYRREVVARCQPNAAHRALAECEWRHVFADFALVTQNVDGLHAAAGSADVIELHGNIWRARCTFCEARRELRDGPEEKRPPQCLECGGPLRPDVVLFGEQLAAGVYERAEAMAGRCQVCLVIGTSALVYPAAALPETAREVGAFLIEINPEETAFSHRCHVSLRGPAGDLVPRLLSL